MSDEKIIVAIDIGHYNLKILVASFIQNKIERCKFLARYKKSFKKKFKVNTKEQRIQKLEFAKEQIIQVLATIEKELGFSLKNSYHFFGVSDEFIKWELKKSKISIDDGVVTLLDYKKLEKSFLREGDTSKIISITKNNLIDDDYCVPNPIGLKTKNLEVENFVASWKDEEEHSAYRNLALNITNFCLFRPNTFVFPYAATSDKDLEEGVLLIDFGAKEVNYLFSRFKLIGAIGSYALGVDCIIEDLADGLDLSTVVCRIIIEKKLDEIYQDTFFYKVNGKAGQKRYIPHESICQIIDLRLEEICQILVNSIKQSDDNFNYKKVIFIGGGSYLPSLSKIAQKVFDKPILLGDLKPSYTPFIHNQENACFGVVIGLIFHGFNILEEKKISKSSKNFFSKFKRFLIED